MTDSTYALPQPIPDDDSLAFWEGCRARRLLLQRCFSCAAWRYPPRPICPQCGALDAEWVQVNGRGFIYSWVVAYHPVHPAVVNRVPYNVVLIELDEGPRVVSNLLDTPPGDIIAGQRVEVVFQPVTAQLTLPLFKRIAEAASPQPEFEGASAGSLPR